MFKVNLLESALIYLVGAFCVGQDGIGMKFSSCLYIRLSQWGIPSGVPCEGDRRYVRESSGSVGLLWLTAMEEVSQKLSVTPSDL